MRDDDGIVNSMNSFFGQPAGTNEHVKAYTHQFGFGDDDYTENSLSPEAINYLRRFATANHGRRKSGHDDDSGTIHPFPDRTEMQFALGRVAEDNVRKVILDGKQYWQILDRYDFNSNKDRLARGERLNMMAEVLKSPLGYDSKRKIPTLLGLGYNTNFLVPVDPNQVARPETVEAHRRATSLSNNPAFPNQTLGGKLKQAATSGLNAMREGKGLP